MVFFIYHTYFICIENVLKKTNKLLIARNYYFWIIRLDGDVGQEWKFILSYYTFLLYNVNFSQDYILFITKNSNKENRKP